MHEEGEREWRARRALERKALFEEAIPEVVDSVLLIQRQAKVRGVNLETKDAVILALAVSMLSR